MINLGDPFTLPPTGPIGSRCKRGKIPIQNGRWFSHSGTGRRNAALAGRSRAIGCGTAAPFGKQERLHADRYGRSVFQILGFAEGLLLHRHQPPRLLPHLDLHRLLGLTLAHRRARSFYR